MTGGFDANVPMRKPRTKIARVISELTSAPAGGEERRAERVEPTPPEDTVVERVYGAFRAAPHPAPESETVSASTSARAPDPAPAYAPAPPYMPARPAAERPPAAPARRATAAPSPVAGSREQIAKLRERLAATAHPRTGAAEPQRTAAAVREIVDGMRDRIEASARERSELAMALETARTALAQANADLSRERRTREGLAAQAEERRLIADDAVAEAEAMAAERDQVLGELAEHRRLEGDQTSLLTEVETALAERDEERESMARELAEARNLANARAAEILELETRLEDEKAIRVRAEARGRELEAEIARLSEAREALEVIEATLHRRRGVQGDDVARVPSVLKRET